MMSKIFETLCCNPDGMTTYELQVVTGYTELELDPVLRQMMKARTIEMFIKHGIVTNFAYKIAR